MGDHIMIASKKEHLVPDNCGSQCLREKKKSAIYRLSHVLLCVGLLCGMLCAQQVRLLRTLQNSALKQERAEILRGRPRAYVSAKELGGNHTVGILDLVKTDETRNHDAFLIFRFPHRSGQGTGNIISGTLAAHLLAEEFKRTICHEYEKGHSQDGSLSSKAAFAKAFDWKYDEHEKNCEIALKRIRTSENQTGTATIVQNNYDHTSEQSECSLRAILANHKDYPIVYYEGNTYPRWPTLQQNQNSTDVATAKMYHPRDYFHEQFKPTRALLEILPWKKPPTIVVHLRDGDGAHDERSGLDVQTMALLAKEDFIDKRDEGEENHDVFLVTNNVQRYKDFPNWSHPNWSLVHHSALERISWGESRDDHDKNYSDRHQGRTQRNKEREALQMWADWYTLLNAKQIYHTHSDFSRSASRWNEKIASWTIRGSSTLNTSEVDSSPLSSSQPRLVLQQDESDNKMKRLVDRTREDLWFCGESTVSEEEKTHLLEKQKHQLMSMIRRRKSQFGGMTVPFE